VSFVRNKLLAIDKR